MFRTRPDHMSRARLRTALAAIAALAVVAALALIGQPTLASSQVTRAAPYLSVTPTAITEQAILDGEGVEVHAGGFEPDSETLELHIRRSHAAPESAIVHEVHASATGTFTFTIDGETLGNRDDRMLDEWIAIVFPLDGHSVPYATATFDIVETPEEVADLAPVEKVQVSPADVDVADIRTDAPEDDPAVMPQVQASDLDPALDHRAVVQRTGTAAAWDTFFDLAVGPTGEVDQPLPLDTTAPAEDLVGDWRVLVIAGDFGEVIHTADFTVHDGPVPGAGDPGTSDPTATEAPSGPDATPPADSTDAADGTGASAADPAEQDDPAAGGSDTGGALPFTGATLWALIAGVGVLVVGGVLLLVARRRRE
ncbi:hypothetical protein [Brevibacterium litoralis]|uniref:hypothetical protein n=1 Tax=Brevibacterium litoralis TaxID=3138935 RepID=UPI0032EFAD25